MYEAKTILIADHYEYLLDGMAHHLSTIKYVETVYKSRSAAEAVDILSNKKIDIVITDICLPDYDGSFPAKYIRKKHPQVKVVVVTDLIQIQHIKPLLRVGINVVLHKGVCKSSMIKAINAALNGKDYYSKSVKAIIDDIIKGKRKSHNNNGDSPMLTPREKDILPYIVRGYTNMEIGEVLHLNHKTIENHRGNIYGKFTQEMGKPIKNAAMLALRVNELGLNVEKE